jgi:hypothetical protein
MQQLRIRLDRLHSLPLAADIRFGPTDYLNDQIWELSQGGGDPPGVNLQTTFGLRTRNFRIFPRFWENDQFISDPTAFDDAPILHTAFPNFAHLLFSPYPGIDVISEYWVPESHAVTGKLTIQNNGVTTRRLRLDWIALLSPHTGGHRMVAAEAKGVSILRGESGGVFPVVFFTGGAQIYEGPYPALSFDIELLPGNSFSTRWAHTGLESSEASFDLARRLAGRSWEPERARIELVNKDLVEIRTGNPEWDIAFQLGQLYAMQLLAGPGSGLPYPSLLITRNPDQGFSMTGDGTDYTHLWNGQTPLHVYSLINFLLPSEPQLAKGLLLNYIHIQDTEGLIDWKPGMSGQRSHMQATPLLAYLAWLIYDYTRDTAFLRQVFDPLYRFIQAWFSGDEDQDGDGIPEWSHPAQMGFEHHPLFTTLDESALGLDINVLESPALCAFLYQECKALIKIAETIDRLEPIASLAAHAENVRAAVQSSWDESFATYRYWDRDTHQINPGVILANHEGSGSLPIRRIFEQPLRLLLRINASSGLPCKPLIMIYGKDHEGQPVEKSLGEDHWQWHLGQGSLTTHVTFSAIESIKIHDLRPDDQFSVHSLDTMGEDISLLLPIWSGMQNPVHTRTMVINTITHQDRYWKPFGLSFTPFESGDTPKPALTIVNLVWNELIGRGLIQYGYRAKAAEHFSHLMKGIAYVLQTDGAFHSSFSALDGTPSGERNSIDSLPPIGFFLEILGVRIYSPWKIRLEGSNPFSGPITINYRGLTIEKRIDKTIVTFPDGQRVDVVDPRPRFVSLEPERNQRQA